MKKYLFKIILFISLKISELSAIIFIPYYLGCLLRHLSFLKGFDNFISKWCLGIWGIMVLLSTLFITIWLALVVKRWIKFNWILVNEWINR